MDFNWKIGKIIENAPEEVATTNRGEQPPAESCDIKGTTSNGAATFYFPHDAGYWQVEANELFCTAQDAEAAGFRGAIR